MPCRPMATSPPPPSEIRFGSLLVYLPRRFTGQIARASQGIMYCLKTDSVYMARLTVSAYVAQRVRETRVENGLREILTGFATLVPAPQSNVHKKGALWPSERIAGALVRNGLGAAVLPCLKRDTAMRKAAFNPGNRPSIREHIQSMRLDSDLATIPTEIVIVDDIVTQGTMFVACAALLSERFPGARISAFAVMRTVESEDGLASVYDPRLGQVWHQMGMCGRNP